MATPVAPGPTTILATLGTVSGSTVFAVAPATLSSISVARPTPRPPRAPPIVHRPGPYSDGAPSARRATASACSMTTVASISGPAGPRARPVHPESNHLHLRRLRWENWLDHPDGDSGHPRVARRDPSGSLHRPRIDPAIRRHRNVSDGSIQVLTPPSPGRPATPWWRPSSTWAPRPGHGPLGGELHHPGRGGDHHRFRRPQGDRRHPGLIEVSPDNVTIPRTTTQQFTALGTFSDSATANITTQVTWTSSDDTVIVISNAALSRPGHCPGEGQQHHHHRHQGIGERGGEGQGPLESRSPPLRDPGTAQSSLPARPSSESSPASRTQPAAFGRPRGAPANLDGDRLRAVRARRTPARPGVERHPPAGRGTRGFHPQRCSREASGPARIVSAAYRRSPVTSRYHLGWCRRAQSRLTVPFTIPPNVPGSATVR